jgi:GNAT superfamily N-acetyltransferase
MYRGLKQIDGVVPLWQEWGDYSESQASLSAIYQGSKNRDKILSLAKQLGVEVDLEQAVSADYVDRAMRGEHEGQQGLTEEINPDCFDPAFNDTQIFDGLTYRATAEKGYDDKTYFQVKVFDSNFQQVGLAKFSPTKRGLVSAMTSIQPEYQGQGLARNIYAYVRSLGNTIAPSRNQLPPGKAMWDSWKKSGDAKYLMRNVAEGLTEYKNTPLQDYNGLQFMIDSNHPYLRVEAFAPGSGQQLAQVDFKIDDQDELHPEDLHVEERWRGQGIAQIMYDFVKSKGYTIHRSWSQTDAGSGFWDKHRGEERVWEQGVAEGSENNNPIANKIFFARSNKAPKGWSYDHIGFITQDGKQIQISGHKGNDVYVTKAVTDDPEFPKQNIKIVSLSKSVSVPTTNSVGAENCGTFVANVLQANGIKGIDTQKIYSVFKKPQKQGLTEGATVTRIDSNPITDFGSSLKAYKHTDDWSQSGVDTGDDSYWKNKNLKTNTTKGLFAGDPKRTALYATGNAHETRYVEFTQNGQPIVYFDRKDLPAMRSRKTYLTVFDASDFRQLPTGEWFSENPSKPIKQVPIGDPFKYIADQGWIVRVTDNLDKVFKQVQNMHKAGKIAQYGAEGMNESKQGVAEASGYIPSEKQKNDPRFSTALTVDVKPDSIKKNAKAFYWNTSRAGIPPTAKPSGKI